MGKKEKRQSEFRIPHNIVEQDTDEEMHEELRRLFLYPSPVPKNIFTYPIQK
jgi:hypothetical protein